MSTFKKILVPFDDNIKSIEALGYAAMFATGIGAKIIALHIADPKHYHSKKEFRKELNSIVHDQLLPKLNEIHKIYPDIRKIDLQILGQEKSLPQHIVDFAAQNDIDFIILRSHGDPDQNDWELHFKKTNAYKVVLEASCPVVTFTNFPQKMQMKNILVAMDIGEDSSYKVPLATALAQQFGSTLHLLSASEHYDDLDGLDEQLNELSLGLKNKGIDVIKNEVENCTLPAAILKHTQNENFDLVMIMSRPRFRWSDLWISPKAKRIISHSHVPVLSIRSNSPGEIGL
ncbi:universal stress protein [Reichenbachiella agarivorans]|uniref:Universal stress protein n=1 Tax=Reichenbachiella agarivorans TaxID=2979464 RepID=A0ABY6CP95_9BACT|nr:universal stress protein [Reichenbachiella agarivorans]UXP32330.1 universal stress protein [Reichenbachiella agarivorans]